MTWRELQKEIDYLTDEQKDSDVMIFDHNKGEFFGVNVALIINDPQCDYYQLEDYHPFISFDR